MTHSYEKFFRGRKITLMGLGLLGRGVGDARFLAACGAKLLVTDLKSAEDLAPSLIKLRDFRNIVYRLGGHRLRDFRGRDMIVKAAGVPLDSPFVAEAKKNKIPVEMDASLFAKLAPAGIIIVGVTGTRGKSTVTHLLRAALHQAGKRVHLAGNVRGLATLPLLKKVRPGDVVLIELDSWQLQGFGEARISPPLAVFTSFMPDHLNYYGGDMRRYLRDKAHIFLHQKPGDVLVTNAATLKEIRDRGFRTPSGTQIILTPTSIKIGDLKLRLRGEHNRANAALAAAAAERLGVSPKDIRRALESFTGMPGRLELVGRVKGVRYYNDTTATTPEATRAALRAFLDKRGRIILIAGGRDKNLDYGKLAGEIKRFTKGLILFRGAETTATEKILRALGGKRRKNVILAGSMRMACREAARLAGRGDVILFSPASASFGMFKNEFDRGSQFVSLVRKMK